MPSKRLCSFTIFAYRKLGMGEDEYHEYLTEKHIPLVQSHYPRFESLSYIVTHITTETKRMLCRLFGPDIPESITMDYYSMFQFLFNDKDDYVRAREDPFYREVIEPDQGSFVDASRTRFVTGWVEILDYGGC
ncbi:hypothetical protein BDV12DRAFT_201209 [Aspergillus spectabilis]